MAAPIMDYIQYINNLPICDATTREILNEYIETLNKIIGSEHEHDIYMKKEIMEGLYITEKEFNTIDFSEKIDLSNHVSKEELNSFNYLTASSDGFCTLTDANKKLDDLKQYIADTLKKYALKSDLDLIKAFLNRLEIRIKNLEDDNKRILEEIEILKSTVYYTIQYEIDKNITNTNNITIIEEGATYSSVLTCDIDYTLGAIQVLMNNVDITAQCVSKTNTKAMINIENVSGPIIIKAQTLVMYTITKNIDNCSITNTNDSIAHGSRYYAQIAANLDYVIVNATLTMGEKNVNNMYMSDTETGGLEIDIPSVTGNIVITVEAEKIIYEAGITIVEYDVDSDGSYSCPATNPHIISGIQETYGITKVELEVAISNISEQQGSLMHLDFLYKNNSILDYFFTVSGATKEVVKIDATNEFKNYLEGNALAMSEILIDFAGGTSRISNFKLYIHHSGSIQCTSLTCNGNMTLDIGNTANLSVKYEPSNTTDTLYWVISDSSALSVYESSGGYWVHAVESGMYTVTFYCGSCSCTCNVRIGNDEIKCTNIAFTVPSISVEATQIAWDCSQYLILTPSNTTDSVEWYNDPVDSFYVDQDGTISFSKVGTYEIQARCNGLSATLEVIII